MDVNNLITQLQNNPNPHDSTVMLVNSIAAQVMADANNPQALLAFTQELQQRSNDIAAAVNANVQNDAQTQANEPNPLSDERTGDQSNDAPDNPAGPTARRR